MIINFSRALTRPRIPARAHKAVNGVAIESIAIYSVLPPYTIPFNLEHFRLG